MKRLIKASMLLMVAALFAACANEDVAQDKKKENETEAPKGGVIFAANGPKVSAKRLSIDGEDEFAGAKTRTNIKHTPGNGADFYWTSDDFIWVWGKDGFPHKSTHTELHDGGASAEFILPGNKADYEDGCKVWYSGQGGYALGPSPAAVAIETEYHLNTANDFSIPGQSDCGSGRAYATGNPAKFNFRLSHKAAYLCFLPRCENAALAPNIRLTRIKLTSTKCYSDPSVPLADYFQFDGETIGPSGARTYTSNSIYMIYFSFPLFTTANQEANAVYCVIRPDTYDFKIEYTIKDPTTNIETVVTQTLTNKTFDKGKIYDITANLTPPVRTAPTPRDFKYYMWDAQKDYWNGYENEQPIINWGQPGATAGTHYPTSKANDPQRWYNDGATGTPTTPVRYDAQTTLFKTQPNVNELYWYLMKCDPHWGGGPVYAVNGHLWQMNGMWLRKKSAIVAYLKTNEHYPSTFTENDLKEGYKTSAIAVPIDYRVTFLNASGSFTQGTPANTTDYFFLPALGLYYLGRCYDFGSYGLYWSSSGDLFSNNRAYSITFSTGHIAVRAEPSYSAAPVPGTFE
ncbi:hypothetical protein [Segatella maculosa]|uniref:hypothetical protein n=1 Tax=Segatella maculosa TaxID=439703 RepID=UPI0028D1ECE8|nr:hypothetical protein [Segatella maculosa]